MTPHELKVARGTRTQVQFAALLGVSAPSLRNWEQGISPVPTYVPTLLRGIANPAPAPTWRVMTLDVRTQQVQIHPATLAARSDAETLSDSVYPFAPKLAHEPSRIVYVIL